ncbi:MAG: SDR family NAD(P)-dependent oxidoreductase [Dehalococcoidia bacterium]
MRIDGRTAIVTGASSGIGRATALALARRHANVVLAARSQEKLAAVADEIRGPSNQVLIVPTDVTDRLSVEALARITVEEFDSVDILVNNAGIGLYAPIAGGNLDNMRRLFEVNYWGAIHCIQAVVPYMLSQHRGHIANVSSVAGKVAPAYMGAYAGTKFALTAASDAVRSELSGTGIHVSTIYPGLTETSFTENMVQEVDIPRIPPIARFVNSTAVANRIVQAIRWNFRDAYVSPEDIGVVGLNAIAPQLVDFGMRTFMRGPQLPVGDIRLPADLDSESGTPAADAEPPGESG